MKWTVYLTPTEHRRINEFVGLLLVTVAVLISLSLVSFDATDPSFNISRNVRFEDQPANLIGVVGSHASDLLFQAIGYAGLLLPVFSRHLRVPLAGVMECRHCGDPTGRNVADGPDTGDWPCALPCCSPDRRTDSGRRGWRSTPRRMVECYAQPARHRDRTGRVFSGFASSCDDFFFSEDDRLSSATPALCGRVATAGRRMAGGTIKRASEATHRAKESSSPRHTTRPKAEKPKDVPPPRASKRRVAEQPSLIPIDEPVVTEMEPVPLKPSTSLPLNCYCRRRIRYP